MRLYLCAIITLVEMLDTSFISSIIGKLMQVFSISFNEASTLYIGLSIGACISLPLAKYCYKVLNLYVLYLTLIIILLLNFFLAFFTSNWQVFCILRFIQGFTLTLLYSVSFLDVVNNSQDKERDINLINGISILGLICGPALSGYITLIGWNYIFLLFNLILVSLIFIIRKINFKSSKNSAKVSFADISEYIIFVFILTLGSLITDGLISIKYIIVLITLTAILILKYRKCDTNFIFNKYVFNKLLLNVSFIHILCRLSVVSLIPLLASILYTFYGYSTLKISMLLTLIGISSLIAKVAYKYLVIFRTHETAVFVIYMGILSIFAFSPFHNMFFYILLFLFGLFSSIIFNYANACIFYRQPAPHTEDLSVILTILQMLLYGLCTTLVFKLFAILEKIFNVQINLAIIIFLMVGACSVALMIYNKYFCLLKRSVLAPSE